MKRIWILMLGLCMLTLSTAQAQQYKIGYFDTQYVLPKMTEYKRAQTEMQTYTKKLEDEFKRKQQMFQKQVQAFRQQEAKMSAAARKAKGEQLSKQQMELQRFQQTAQTRIDKKRGNLLNPIYKKVEAALAVVAKEGKYNFIIRKETALFSNKKYDISDVVLKKLGIKTN
ncbi:OmpH family outer membrane protein [uncultured Microscilla sp.]|uniref:OmpH family outer membrane protein n=1 Tax=uncultured Microscilla sp. TaxID=432653 RepID=UPI00262993BB|nr:OmpH family outer membrane protein [uncultured Microscilla sp.]